jgi:hypothetical protein
VYGPGWGACRLSARGRIPQPVYLLALTSSKVFTASLIEFYVNA